MLARRSIPQVVQVNAPYAEQLLFLGRGLDLQALTDQPLTKIFGGTNFIPTRIYSVRKTGGVTVACSGGIYTAASAGGTAIVAIAQSYAAVTGTLGFIACTIAALTAGFGVSTLYLTLAVGSTAAATADVFVFGVVID